MSQHPTALPSTPQTRSGFDGPWTHDPLKFDNSYFKNLLDLEWKPRQWDGPLQYEDPSHTLMMLPTDIALTTGDDLSSLPPPPYTHALWTPRKGHTHLRRQPWPGWPDA